MLLALWNLRPGGAEQFTSGSPREHVLQVIDSLLYHLELEEREVLLDNYAESFLQMASHPYKGTEHAKPLRNVARKFRNLLACGSSEEQEDVLKKIRDEWSS